MTDMLLGVDAGTSGIKVCAFDPAGRLIAKAHRGVPVITPYPLWAEIDLARYWDSTAEAIAEVIGRVGPVASVGLATTCPTTVVLDGNFDPVRPAMLYLDGRCDPDIARIVGGDDAAVFACTGNRASPSVCWAANLAWMARCEPGAWARVRHVSMLNGFLAHRLTGNIAMDPTQASYSGLYRVGTGGLEWDAEMVRLWGIDPALLPEIREPAAPIGGVADAAAAVTGIAAGTPVALGAADTASAAFALGQTRAGSAFESVGTSGVITFCLDRPDFEMTFLNRRHIAPGRFLAHGAMSTLGGAFGWLNNKVWPELRTLAELERLAAESVPGANGLIFLPYLAGERSPIWDTEASGAWIGLRLSHTRQDMVRAVFEGAAFGLRQILERAEAQWGGRPPRLVGVGGGARSRFWAQIKADVLNLEYAMTDMADASALGAALMGAVAAGRFSGPEDPALPTVAFDGQPIRPGPEARRAAYDRMYGVFSGVYPALRGAMHDLAAASAS